MSYQRRSPNEEWTEDDHENIMAAAYRARLASIQQIAHAASPSHTPVPVIQAAAIAQHQHPQYQHPQYQHPHQHPQYQQQYQQNHQQLPHQHHQHLQPTLQQQEQLAYFLAHRKKQDEENKKKLEGQLEYMNASRNMGQHDLPPPHPEHGVNPEALERILIAQAKQAAAARAAAQHLYMPQAGDVISIASSSDEEMAAPKPPDYFTNIFAPPSKKRGRPAKHDKEKKKPRLKETKAPKSHAKPTTESPTNRPRNRQVASHKSQAQARSFILQHPGPGATLSSPSASALSPPQEQVARQHSPPVQRRLPSSNDAGPFVRGVLSGRLLKMERNANKKKAVSNIILCATGHTKETAPPSMLFPPPSVTINLKQISDLADGFLDDRNKAVSEAVRIAYLEMKSFYESRVSETRSLHSTPHQPVPGPVHQSPKKSDSEAKLRDEKDKLEKEVETLKRDHRKAMAAVQQRALQQQDEIAALNEKLENLEHRQGRSISAYMSASVHSLRLLRSKTNYIPEEEEKE